MESSSDSSSSTTSSSSTKSQKDQIENSGNKRKRKFLLSRSNNSTKNKKTEKKSSSGKTFIYGDRKRVKKQAVSPGPAHSSHEQLQSDSSLEDQPSITYNVLDEQGSINPEALGNNNYNLIKGFSLQVL